MPRKNSVRAYTWAVLLLLVTVSYGQNTRYPTFDWRPMKIQRQTSALPYKAEATTSSYDSRYYDSSLPYHAPVGYYPDSSGPYQAPYSEDSYSADYQKNQPYHHHPEDSGSYEQYGYTRDDTFNVTKERYGGFGGTGDTRGFGAYDYPKKVQEEVPQDLRHEPRGTHLPDLLRIGRDRIYHRGSPSHVHPLPPPL